MRNPGTQMTKFPVVLLRVSCLNASKSNTLNQTLFYSVIEGGKYVATAQVCEVEKHVSAGFRMDDYMQGGRYAYVMVYFSQGGSWKNIGNSEFFSYSAWV